MGKDHMKRLSSPRTWPIKRKGITFLTRPNPGAHSFEFGISINTLLKEMMKVCSTSREVRVMLNASKVLVNGKAVSDVKYLVGLMDTISIPDLKKNYRIVINDKNKLSFIEIDEKEANLKLSQIKGKSFVKGNLQLNLSDGRNILVKKDEYKVGDTLVLEVPSLKIVDHLKFEKGALVYLVKGKHVGDIGKLEDIQQKIILFKSKSGKTFETVRSYAFVVGKDKEIVKLIE